jgi:hypothetical protein
LLTDGDYGVYWATLTLTKTTAPAATTAGAAADTGVDMDVDIVVDRCALSGHVAKGACYLGEDCAATYGGKAISLWLSAAGTVAGGGGGSPSTAARGHAGS